jgi:ATP-binding cassette subfamily G (WHITE) protein 2 (SNQ2)
MLSNSQVDMQNRLFSIFITLTISPPLIQQLQPRYIDFRNIFSARENKSKIYNWFSFVFSAFIVEVPWSILFGTIYYCCWYWGVGFPRGTLPAGYIWLLLMSFEIYYVSFGQAMAAVSPNAVFASLLVPTLFSFVIAFCGVLAPPAAMPHFWSSWMYCISPSLASTDSRADAISLSVGGDVGCGGSWSASCLHGE